MPQVSKYSKNAEKSRGVGAGELCKKTTKIKNNPENILTFKKIFDIKGTEIR